MQFFGGGELVTTTPPPPAIDADPNTYTLGRTVPFFASVTANSADFFSDRGISEGT